MLMELQCNSQKRKPRPQRTTSMNSLHGQAMLPFKKLVSFIGYMSRIASVAPVARPFVWMLWGALTDHTQRTPKRNTTRKRLEKLVFVRRISHAMTSRICSLRRVRFGEHSLRVPEEVLLGFRLALRHHRMASGEWFSVIMVVQKPTGPIRSLMTN